MSVITFSIPYIFTVLFILPFFAGAIILLFSPGISAGRFRNIIAIALLTVAIVAVDAALLAMRFGLGGTFDFIRRLFKRSFIYQDVQFLSIVCIVSFAVSLVAAFFIRFLIHNRQPLLSRFQEGMIVAVVFIALFSVAFSIAFCEEVVSHVGIAEVHGDGSGVYVDGIFTTQDYIVLANTNTIPVDLSDLYLSDNSKKLQKMPLAGNAIDAGGTLRLFLDDTSPFRIHKKETIHLSDKSGRIIAKYMYVPVAAMTLVAPVFSKPSGFYDD